MSYTHIAPGCTFNECDQIFENIDSKLWFVGEHTNCLFLGTVHGAYLSGTKAANEILASQPHTKKNTSFI